jgi:hypothetical protein
MKLKQKNFFTKKKIITTVLALVLISGGGAYAFFATHPSIETQDSKSQSADKKDKTETNTQPATTQQIQAGENQKQDILNKDQASPTTPSSLTVTITAANQNGNVVNIRSLINTVSNSGNCTLTITNGTSTTTLSSDLQALADSSTCKGFDVPASSLPKGTWHIVVDATVGTSHGFAQKDIVVN